MKYHKILRSLISFLCAVSLLLSVCSFPTYAVTAKTVTATTSSTVRQGNTAYCYVMIDSLESLAALDVSVHFDNAKVKIIDVYNSVDCTLYDSVVNASNIQFSYIFNGNGAASQSQLFYFVYQVLGDAEIGETCFDITIGEAYDESLNNVAVLGSRCSFTIAETETVKYCSVYGNGAVSTAVGETFSLSYRFSTSQIASGAAVLHYDPELFEVVEATAGEFLDGKVADINTSLAGSIYISFVGTQYNSSQALVTVQFKTLKNVDERSDISLTVTELYDLQLKPITCSGYTTTVTIRYDRNYLGDAAQMAVNATFDENAGQVVVVINLSAKSMLGAGDFVLQFDPELLTLSSYTKGFTPNFFNINDKQVSEGVFKFSIISLSNIVDAQTVLTLVFDAAGGCTPISTAFDLSGSMITDSFTELIPLNLIDGNITIPEMHQYSGGCDHSCDLCGAERESYVNHTTGLIVDENCYLSNGSCYAERVAYCALCGEEISRVTVKLYMIGDANSDGQINVLDAMKAAQYIVGNIKGTALNINAADVNGDGLITVLDTMQIAQFVVGEITRFEIENDP